MLSTEYKRPYIIESAACKHFNIGPLELRFGGKEQPLVWVRFIVWRALYAVSGFSYPDIAKRYSRDHTTIINGVNQVNNSEDLSRKYDEFLARYIEKTVDNVLVDSGITGGTTS